MAAPTSRGMHRQERLDRLWWLPRGGLGNGIEDHAWAPIAEVSDEIAAPLLEAFRTTGIAAYAASVQPAPGRRAARSQSGAIQRIWVGTSAYGRAVETLIKVMPALARQPSGYGRDPAPVRAAE